MAQNNNNPQGRQPPASYPSSHSYPSPPLNPAYAYPPPGPQHSGETFRESPPDPNLPLPSISHLAPLHGRDTHPQASHQPIGPGSIPPAGMIHGGSSYYPPPGSHYNGTGMHGGDSPGQQGMPGRFSMDGVPPGPDPRMMSGGRNKKDIKRRTKTGCLTCRKRRIKCDEQHPICRNCQKSKRECLGYDPIFKQEHEHGPASIRPALSTAAPASPLPATAATPTSTYSSVPQGYAPASISSPSPSANPPYDYNSAIDPALAGADSTALTSANAFEGPTAYRQDIKGALENGSPFAVASPDGPSTKLKRTLKIDDLFMIDGDPPTPAAPKEVSPEMYEEINVLYTKDYAKGIDAFLETTWYSTQGLKKLLSDVGTCELFQSYIEQLQKVKSEDYDGMRKIPGHEARVIWALMCLARKTTTDSATDATQQSYDEQLNDVSRRLAIFESLITGQIMDSNPLAHTQPLQGATKDTQYFRTEFWRLLGKFVSLPAEQSQELRQTLSSLRIILRQHENRDVLYSMAIVRHNGIQAEQQASPETREKVAVAKTFIENEASGQGTTQVIQRLCGMAARGWMAMR